MGSPRGKAKGRHEPRFDAFPVPGMNLRPSLRDRPAGPPAEETERARRTPAKRKDSKPAASEKPRPRAHGSEDKGEARPARKRGGSSGGGKRRSLLGRLFYWGAVLGLWVAIIAIGAFLWFAARLPPIQSLEIPKRPPAVQILGLNGSTLATRGDMGGAAVALKDLPPHLPQAFLAIEDRRFYKHHGVDLWGVTRAVVANLLRRNVTQGGSTLTQQLAKNLFLTQERSFDRKIQELVLALWLEHKFSKREIFDLYLNRVYFGAGAYGVEAASQRYFGKSARQVTLAEAAMLAGLVKSPSRLSPARNPDGAERRAHLVLTAMVDAGFISENAAKTAIAQEPQIIKPTAGGSVNYAADWIMDVINDLLGNIEQDIVVETSIDTAMQAAAEKALIEELAQKGEKFGVGQGAIVALSPDGAVRAMVGGRNYGQSQFNRAVAAKRQPGSAFKPFVFLTALERGLTPDTMRDDRPIAIKGWRPENYTREYFGPVTLDARARAVAQHGLGAPHPRGRAEGGGADRAPTRHRLAAQPECLDRARHLGSLRARAHLGASPRSRTAARGSFRAWWSECAASTGKRSTGARRRASAASSTSGTSP